MTSTEAARSHLRTHPAAHESAQTSPKARPPLASVIPLLRFLTVMALLLAVAAFPRSAFFTVREIAVEGTHQVPPADVIARSGLHLGQLLFTLPAREAALRIASYPRIASAVVSIAGRGRVRIRVTERIPRAAYVYKGGFLLVDPQGVAIEQRVNASGLPVISVDGAAPPWVRLGDVVPSVAVMQMLAALDAMPESVAGGARVRMARNGDLGLTTADGITVLLGQPRGLAERAVILPQVLEAVRTQHLSLAYLDMRFAGNVVMRPASPTSAPGGVHR